MEDMEQTLQDVIDKAQDCLDALQNGNALDSTQQAFYDSVSKSV